MDLGGAEKLTRLTVESLPKDQFTASVCCLKTGGHYAEQLRARGFTVWELLGVHKHAQIGLAHLARASWRLFRLLRRERPDIIHVHLFAASILGRVIGRLSGVPRVIVTLHRIEYPRVQPMLERILSPLTAKYVTDSHAAAAKLSHTLHISPQRILVIYNGIDQSEFAAPPSRAAARAELGLSSDEPTIGIIAHLYPEKGHSFLLEALAKVQGTLGNFKLLVVGDGHLRPTLEAQARETLPAGSVRFLGQRADLATLLSAMDILALPSSWEGFGIILAEAMYMGVPVVTTSDGGGCAEVATEEDGGLLVPYGAVDALGSAMVRLLTNAVFRREMGKRGRARATRLFCSEAMGRQYVGLYTRSARPADADRS